MQLNKDNRRKVDIGATLTIALPIALIAGLCAAGGNPIIGIVVAVFLLVLLRISESLTRIVENTRPRDYVQPKDHLKHTSAHTFAGRHYQRMSAEINLRRQPFDISQMRGAQQPSSSPEGEE